ncbi:MAG: PEP-CTERM sorting domain-containing protein, partial [Microcystis aeruginosa LL13-03]|nr:PEP-CTERM sorting domain-containing protein [Microcystis aeruginosa LL13-03]NCR47321.1 PEP-CTERM sorting domain-containing protein [Microcystis aeruginosa SX13-01]
MAQTLTKIIKNAVEGKHYLLVAGATLAILAPFQAAQAVTVVVGTGTVTGYFDNPITLPSSVYTGIGTDTIEWGTPFGESFTNQLSFTPSDFVFQPKGQDFVAGRLYYRNGTIFGGTGIDGVDLIIDTNSSDPDFTQTLPLKITIVNTPNVADDPIASADFIYFTDFPDRGSFRVLEGEDTDVEVITQFNS